MDVLTYYTGDTAPAIRRGLALQDGGDQVVNASLSYRLRVRSLWSDSVVIDASMTPDLTTEELVYQPVAGNFATEGTYRAWIFVDSGGGNTQQTDEFEIRVLAHAPGEATRVGAIWRAARALEPVSWDALRGYSDYGDTELQRVIELAKLRVVPYPVTAAEEENLDPRVVDYIAKKVLVDNVLSAAISFWTNQTISQSARGNTEEVVSYPDRIRAAEAAILRYAGDLERQAPEVDQVLGTIANAFEPPMVDTIGPLLTPGLEEYPAQRLTPQRYRGRTVRW